MHHFRTQNQSTFFLDGKNKTSKISLLFPAYLFFSQNFSSARLCEIFWCPPKLHCLLKISSLLKIPALIYGRWRRCPDSSEKCLWVNPASHCSLFPMYMLLWVSLSKTVSVISTVIPRCILFALPFSLFIFRLFFKAILRFQPVLNETLPMAMCYSCLLCQLSNL